MKKFAKFALLILIPVTVGIILIVTGVATENDNLFYAGMLVSVIGVPVVMIPLVVTGIVLVITGKMDLYGNKVKDDDISDDKKPKRTAKAEKPKRTAKNERKEIDEINSSSGYRNRYKKAEYEANHAALNYENADKGDKIKGWLFFGFLVADFVLILVFAFLGITLGAIICFCLFVGSLLIGFIVSKILEKTSQSEEYDPLKHEIKTGVVQTSVLSSSTSMGGKWKQRIKKVTYRVIIEVGNKTYNAYSKNFYEDGESVEVILRRDGKGNARIKSSSNDEPTE